MDGMCCNVGICMTRPQQISTCGNLVNGLAVVVHGLAVGIVDHINVTPLGLSRIYTSRFHVTSCFVVMF